MITLKSILEDAKINSKIDEANDTYFKSFTQAVEYARKATEKRGFTIEDYLKMVNHKGSHCKSLYLGWIVVLMN